jgi:CheY-like chemotaxis protein
LVSVASDGQAALNWLAEHGSDLDVVLMDVQMPVMDGQEAARRIRLNPLLADLPIIALTAGVFRDQKKAAQDAGMNGFIAKPLNVNELISTIWQLTGRMPDGMDEGHADAAHPRVVTAQPDVAFPGIDVQRGLNVWRKMSAYHKVLAKFVMDYGDCVGRLVTCNARGDHVAAKALAHKLKGTAANLALTGIVRCVVDIELSLAEDRDYAPLLDRLHAEFVAVQNSIARLAPGDERITPTHCDDLARTKVILGALLRSFDEDNPNQAEGILAGLADLIPADLLAELQSRLEDFDFRGAEQLTHRLAAHLGVVLDRESK